MILEIAILNIKPGQEHDFEQAFQQARPLVESTPGHLNTELRRCVEHPSRYALLINWEFLEAHTEGFQRSPAYQDWKALLHHFYAPFPEVEHYESLEF